MQQERTFKFEGKTYKESDLNDGIVNIFLVQGEMNQSKLRHEIELEKIWLSTNYFAKNVKKVSIVGFLRQKNSKN